MKERPILFSGPMVRAILAGRKTQTRRALKPKAPIVDVIAMKGKQRGRQWLGARQVPLKDPGDALVFRCRLGEPGDRLWVRESGWERPERTARMIAEGADTWAPYYYDADGEDAESLREWGFKRRPSIFMPRKFSRITLEITAVRVERLFKISERDCRAEGIFSVPLQTRAGRGWISDEGQPVSETARRAYEDLWHSINRTWMDCWVWVIEFRRIA